MTFAMELNIAVAWKGSWKNWNRITNQGGPQGLYGNEATYYEDSNNVDAILTMDVAEYCFVAWRGERVDHSESNQNNCPPQRIDA